MTTHALPLIPPTDSVLTLAECTEEIRSLASLHKEAINAFWKTLPSIGEPPPDGVWNSTQKNLHRLFYDRKKRALGFGYEEPDLDGVRRIWDSLITSFDAELRSRLAMNSYASFDLVAIISEGDEQVLVHKYEAEDLYNLEEDGLFVPNSEGETWFYECERYEPDGFGEGPYSRACLYLFGILDKDTGAWTPKHVDPTDFYQFQQTASEMASLTRFNEVTTFRSVALPEFPSGHETRLQELGLLRKWLSETSRKKWAEERNVLNEATAHFANPLNELQEKIRQLQDQVEEVQKNKSLASLQAFAGFWGLEIGQTLVNIKTGQEGTLVLKDTKHPYLAVLSDGQEFPGSSWEQAFAIAIREQEWRAKPDTESQNPSNRPSA